MSPKKASTGFSADEKAAMRERVREMKAGAADGESEVLAKIAEMGESDRAMAERIHEIVKATAPELSPRTWYGMPAYAKDGKVVCFSRARRSSRRATRRWASATRRTSTRARCGRRTMRSRG